MTSPSQHKAGSESSESREDAHPERIAGRYQIKDLLGRGGFGAVYRAYDELEERLVALKVIRTDKSGSRGTRSRMSSSSNESVAPSRFGSRTGRPSVTRAFGTKTPNDADYVTEAFKDEFRLLTQLHHPNLAAVHDFGRCEELDGVFFTQELVEGKFLTEYLEGKPREVIVDIFVQLARALDYIHALGLVHEDIKPTNVLVWEREDGQPRAKLIDFGLARMFRKPETKETEEGEDGSKAEIIVHGTPGFSAPEKVRGEKTDSRSDIYSLAATIYTASRGSRPFPSKTFKEALRAQGDWRPELAGALLPRCGPVVAELVGRMLQPDPERRPQSARAIVLELLRREASHIRDRQETKQDRDEFARMLVEHLPFVDRAGYLDLLLTRASEILLITDEESEASRSGSRNRVIRSVMVEAPEGMGKARLMAELRREIQLGGGLFVQTSFWAADHSALGPYGPVVMQLATALGDSSEVVKEFPELVASARDPDKGSNQAGKLFEFLIAASAEMPFVLHLSELSRNLAELPRLEELCRAIDHSKARIMLCATSVPHRKMAPLLLSLGRDQVAEEWNLRPFTAREMHSVLSGILGDTSVIQDLVKMLDKLTGGHPLSFRETLRVLIEESILVRDADNWSLRGTSAAAEELHKSLAQRSESRLDSLGVSAWEVASVLFLIEAPIEEEQLAELSDLRKERFRRTMDRLEGEGLIMRDATSRSSLVMLAHESVREAVRRRYADSLDETRIDLAARIEELETTDPNLIFLRARMLDDAADDMESVEALKETTNALYDAGQPYLGSQVTERLLKRLRIHGTLQAAPDILAATLQLLDRGAGALDDPRREASHYECAIMLAELLDDFRAQAVLWLGLADRYLNRTAETDVDVTLWRLGEAAEAAKKARDRVLELRIANRRAELLLSVGDIEQAGSYSRQAMEIVELDQAHDVDVCHIIGVRLRCLSLSGQLGEARRLHEMGKPIAERTAVVQRMSYLSGIAFLGALGGEPERAIPELAGAIEDLRALNMPRLLVLPLHNLGDLLLRDDQLEEAAAALQEAIRLSEMFGMDHNVYLNRGFLGYAQARMGQLEEGASMLADAKAEVQQMSGEHVSWQQLRLLDAEVAHLMGHSARARRELEEMLADFHTSNEVSLAHWAQDALARIERDLGTSFIETPLEDHGSNPDEDTVRTKPIR